MAIKSVSSSESEQGKKQIPLLLETLRIFPPGWIASLPPERVKKEGSLYLVKQENTLQKGMDLPLVLEEEVLQLGFAGHTIEHYPEPARSYHLAYGSLKWVLETLRGTRPLLVSRLNNEGKEELLGIMNYVWSTAVGIVPVQRRSENQLLVTKELDQALPRVQVLREGLNQLRFSTSEVLKELPGWC